MIYPPRFAPSRRVHRPKQELGSCFHQEGRSYCSLSRTGSAPYLLCSSAPVLLEIWLVTVPQTGVQRAVLHRPASWQPTPMPTVGKVWATPPDKCVLSRQCQESKDSWVLAADDMEKARGPLRDCSLHRELVLGPVLARDPRVS